MPTGTANFRGPSCGGRCRLDWGGLCRPFWGGLYRRTSWGIGCGRCRRGGRRAGERRVGERRAGRRDRAPAAPAGGTRGGDLGAGSGVRWGPAGRGVWPVQYGASFWRHGMAPAVAGAAWRRAKARRGSPGTAASEGHRSKEDLACYECRAWNLRDFNVQAREKIVWRMGREVA